jgi:DNA-binding NtrC family response regulator
MADILVVDDDEQICAAFDQFLSGEGHSPRISSNAQDALKQIESGCPDLVLMDIRMPGGDGLTALREIRERFPALYVVIMTAYGTSQTSIEAMRVGAFDYLTKPLDLDELKSVIDKALEAQVLSAEVSAEPSDDATEASVVGLVGSSPQMQDAYKLIGLLASNDIPALITGERGTGKHLVAHTIHQNSERKDRPFVAIHCRSLPEDFVRTELFGRELPGAETGTSTVSRGKLESTTGGTLFLDDIDALSLPLQAKLLRFLLDRTLERIGGVETVYGNVRIIAATRFELDELTIEGDFNEELYHRLRVLSVHLPPLRERREDVPKLVSHFLKRFSLELNRTIKGVDERVLRLFQDYTWPGNVRELESVIQRACVLAPGEVILPGDLGESMQGPHVLDRAEVDSGLEFAVRRAWRERLIEKKGGAEGSPFHDIVQRVEATLVREVLSMTSGNQLRAAELLGVNRTTLRNKMQLYDIK